MTDGIDGAGGFDWDDLLAQLDAVPVEPGWMTIAEAAEAASVSVSTLRAWYRSGAVPSRLVAGVHGPQRLVPIAEVVERAMRSPRVFRKLERSRSLEAEVAALRERVDSLERAVRALGS